jgi:transcriptional regulator with XRE-family HTH domain
MSDEQLRTGRTSPKTGDLELGRRIARRRDELGMTRKELADAVGISYPYLAQIETGYRLPSAKHQVALSSILGISLDEMFDTEHSPLSASAVSFSLTGASTDQGRRPTLEEAVDRATLELEALPASVRLDALSRVQLRIMRGVAGSPAHQWS